MCCLIPQQRGQEGSQGLVMPLGSGRGNIEMVGSLGWTGWLFLEHSPFSFRPVSQSPAPTGGSAHVLP